MPSPKFATARNTLYSSGTTALLTPIATMGDPPLSLPPSLHAQTHARARALLFSPPPLIGRGPIREAAPSIRRCHGPQRSSGMGRGAAGPSNGTPSDRERPGGAATRKQRAAAAAATSASASASAAAIAAAAATAATSASENYKRVSVRGARTRHMDSTVYFYSGHHGAGQLVNRHSLASAALSAAATAAAALCSPSCAGCCPAVLLSALASPSAGSRGRPCPPPPPPPHPSLSHSRAVRTTRAICSADFIAARSLEKKTRTRVTGDRSRWFDRPAICRSRDSPAIDLLAYTIHRQASSSRRSRGRRLFDLGRGRSGTVLHLDSRLRNAGRK